jgi:hypothetical protein
VSLALSQTESQLEIVFNTADDVEAVSDPVEYILYVDQDCRADTGSADGDLGVDLRVRYRHSTQKTYLHRYDDVNESWAAVETAEASNRVRGNQVTLVVPNQVLDQSQPFCWVAQAKNRADGFASSLPADALPDHAGSLFTPLDATDSAAQ